jgi:hypothetical protein
MTDLEINEALALAIGWKPEQITRYEGQEYIGLPVRLGSRPMIKLFHYKFWNVIGPIAAKFDLFPLKAICSANQWAIVTESVSVYADTPQKTIALAVIQGAKK